MRNKTSIVATVSFFFFLLCAFGALMNFRETPSGPVVESDWSPWVWSAGVFAVIFIFAISLRVWVFMQNPTADKIAEGDIDPPKKSNRIKQ